MCHRVPESRRKYEKTTIFQGKMDFRKTPVGDVALFLTYVFAFPEKIKKI